MILMSANISPEKPFALIGTSFSFFSGAFFRSTQRGVHQVVVGLQKGVEIPELILKVVDFSVTIFSFHTEWSLSVKEIKHTVKEIKNVFQWIKGLKSIDGFLNGPYSWKYVILNLSSFVLLILSTLTLSEWLQLVDISSLKVMLAALPVFGILPFGGLLPLAFLGLFSMLLLLTLEKRQRIGRELQKAQTKNQVWSNSLTPEKVSKISLKMSYLPLVDQNLDAYHLSKQKKWALRLKKWQGEEKIANQAMIRDIIKISRQVLMIGAAFSGWGVLGMIGMGLDGIDGILIFKQFFDKRALKVLSKSVA